MSSFFNLFESSIVSNPRRVLISGDSTIAAFACRTNTIASQLFSIQEYNDGNRALNIAVGGHTINQQRMAWANVTDKSSYDWIVVQVGLNDCVTGNSSTAISSLQTYVNEINSTKKAEAKLLLSCMLPCKYRWTYLNETGISPNNPIASQQTWIDINKAIMNQNTLLNNISGVDHRNNYHVSLMDDGSGNLKTQLDCGDYIHENQEGADIIIQGFRNAIIA